MCHITERLLADTNLEHYTPVQSWNMEMENEMRPKSEMVQSDSLLD